MAEDETSTKDQDEAPLMGGGEVLESDALEKVPDDASAAPTNLGATKYVHAAFFVVGIATAFISGRILAGIWNALAAWAPAVHAVPQLLLYGEDERPEFTIVVGIFIGIAVVVQMFRRPGVRTWCDDVATELSKVVWPSRETVTNGTIVVVVASALATIYVGLLDRLWAFVTQKIYGA
ncbi:MAG TPA: preprotein translocase subunit SecE [Polyangiaceae bacterium]|jgi:preprotein translocase subunit SecE|nr:preprotein translocase subunit SecE [Polyangiaceae bacterium]